LVLSRDLNENELTTLRRLFAKASGVPEGPRLVRTSALLTPNSGKDRSAMKAVASVLLNLDAALTR